MKKYMEIVFIQNEEAETPLKILEEQGEDAAMNYLRQWDYGDDDGEIYYRNPGGSGDSAYRKGNFVMSYNTSLGYIGLCKIIDEEEQK